MSDRQVNFAGASQALADNIGSALMMSYESLPVESPLDHPHESIRRVGSVYLKGAPELAGLTPPFEGRQSTKVVNVKASDSRGSFSGFTESLAHITIEQKRRNKKRRELYPKNPLDWEKIYGTYICVVDRPNANRVFETSDVVGNTVEDIAMSLGLNPDRFMVDNGFFKYRVDRTCFVVDECPFLILNERPEQYPPPKCYLEFIWNDAAGDSLLDSTVYHVDLVNEPSGELLAPISLALRHNEITDETDMRDVVDKIKRILRSGDSTANVDSMSVFIGDQKIDGHTKLSDLRERLQSERMTVTLTSFSALWNRYLATRKLDDEIIDTMEKWFRNYSEIAQTALDEEIFNYAEMRSWVGRMADYRAVFMLFSERTRSKPEKDIGMFIVSILPVMREVCHSFFLDVTHVNELMKKVVAGRIGKKKSLRKKVERMRSQIYIDRLAKFNYQFPQLVNDIAEATPEWHPDYVYICTARMEIGIMWRQLPYNVLDNSKYQAEVIFVPDNMRSDIAVKEEQDHALRERQTQAAPVPTNQLSSLVGLEKKSWIGSGGAGDVFLYVGQDGHKYAVKFVRETEDEYVRKAMHREVVAMERFHHPCLLEIRGKFRQEKGEICRHGLITDYMENGSLGRVLLEVSKDQAREFWNDRTKIVIIIVGIILGVRYINNSGNAHRDLKPENVLLDENYLPRISDFGTCRQMDDSVSLGKTCVGTPIFMAPEVRSGEYDKRVDIYSFSAMLLQILAECNEDSLKKYIGELHAGRTVACLEQYPDWIVTKVKQGLSVNPEDRFDNWDTILATLCEHDFQIWDGVDVETVREYMTSIEPDIFDAISVEGDVEEPYMTSLDGLTMVKKIGKGTYGKVYLYTGPCGQQYAVKEMHPDQECEDSFRSNVARETSAMKVLRHPCLLKICGGFTVEPTEFDSRLSYFVITEYMENGSLEDVAQNRRKKGNGWWSDNTRVAILLVGVALGLKFIHDKKYIYRDLKPLNVLVDRDYCAQIADFGSCRTLPEDGDEKMTIAGTRVWMAPEVLNEAYGYQVDVFSFGMLVWYMLAVDWKLIFNFSQRLKNHHDTRPSLPKSCPKWVQELVEKSLKWDPSDRYQDFGEVLQVMQENHFKIWDDVDETKVCEFIERCSGAPCRQEEAEEEEEELCDVTFTSKYHFPIPTETEYITSIDKFTRGKVCGRGAYGEVRVYSDANGVEYAVKMVELMKDEIKIMKREIETMQSLHHPCLLELRGSFEQMGDDTVCYGIVTDYMEKGSLAKVLSDAAVDNAPEFWAEHTKVVIIIVGIILGVWYIHGSGRVHRDLKPANVLLDDNYLPHVGDFGTCRETTADLTMSLVGTPLFMAPEVRTGHYDERVDVYSFSAMLLQILTECDAKSLERYIGLIHAGKPVPCLQQYPEWVVEIVEQGLRWDPKERFPEAENEAWAWILNALHANDFQIWDDVDGNEVFEYVQGVGEYEQRQKSSTGVVEFDKLVVH